MINDDRINLKRQSTKRTSNILESANDPMSDQINQTHLADETKLRTQNNSLNRLQARPNVTNRTNSSDQLNTLNQVDSSNDHLVKSDSFRIISSRQVNRRSNITRLDRLLETYLSLQSQLDTDLLALNFSQAIETMVNDAIDLSTISNQHSSSERHPIKRSLNYMNIYDEKLPVTYPRKKDWRDSNVISAVDNQNLCGACWAHSTIETIESMAGKLMIWCECSNRVCRKREQFVSKSSEEYPMKNPFAFRGEICTINFQFPMYSLDNRLVVSLVLTIVYSH